MAGEFAALLISSKGLERPSPIMAPKPTTGWDPQWLSPQDSQAKLSFGARTPQGLWPSQKLLIHLVSSWCPLCSGSAENQVAGTKLFPCFWTLLSLLPPPLCTSSADSEDRKLLRGDPDPCKAQVTGGLGNPRTQCHPITYSRKGKDRPSVMPG